MNKITKLFTAMVLFIAGTAMSQAQYWLVDTSESDYPNVQEIVPDMDYALENAWSADYNDFLNGHTKSTVVTDDCLYNFEEAGINADGDQTWYLKRKSDGKYVKDPDFMLDSESGIYYTGTKAMAFKFVAKLAEKVETQEEATAATNPFTTYAPDGTDAWVFRKDGISSDLYLWANDIGSSNGPSFSSSRDANAWKVVTVTEATGYERVYSFLKEKFPNGFNANSFKIGNDVGCVSDGSKLDAMSAAYDESQILINTASTDEAACTACIEKLKTAYDALIASVIQLEAGYYYVVNFQSDGCIYDSEGNGAHWTDNFPIPEKPTAESAPYIWQFIPEGDSWYLRNYKTQNYLGAVDQMYKAIPIANDPAPYSLIPSEGVDDGQGGVLSGYFWIANMAAQDKLEDLIYLHAQLDNRILVYWYNNSGSAKSCWRFTKVNEEDLKDLNNEINRAQVQESIKEIVGNAKSDIANAKNYLSDATPDDLLDEAGLVGPEQISSNATETSEGSLDALFDSDFGTFFHSMWSATPDPNDWHYLQADLGMACQNIVLKYVKRNNFNDDAQGTGSPTKITVLSADSPEGPWNEETTINVPYQYKATYTSNKLGECEPTELDNRVGVVGFEMGAPHQFVRLVVKETIGNGKTEGYPYFYWSELRFYEAQYDEENSLLSVIDKDVLKNLTDQMAAASAAVKANTATQADLDALQAAYDKFLEFYPKPATVTTLLDEANALHDGSFEGEGLGYYEAGSKEALKAAIDEVTPQVKEVMTIDEVNSCKAKLNEAIAAFNGKLITPEDGKLYYIRSLSSNEIVTGHYVYAPNSNPALLRHGGYELLEGAEVATPDVNIENSLNYMWVVSKAEDGTFNFRNLGTGLYMTGVAENEKNVGQAEAAAKGITLRGTPELAGSFNIVFAPGIYANSQPASNLQTAGSLVTWDVASGADNSAVEFVEIETMPFLSSVEVGTNNTIITLPYAIMSEAAGKIYQVSGIMDNAIQLVPFKDGIVPAGTPFVYIPEEGTEVSNDLFALAETLNTPADLTYNFTPASVNGLVGTLTPQEVSEGVGFFIRGMVIAADSKVAIAANSGYFNAQLPVVTEAGECSLPVIGEITGIKGLDVVDNKAKMDVYTLSGMKVRSGVNAIEATRNLPAGIYIVGGKKVLVK